MPELAFKIEYYADAAAYQGSVGTECGQLCCCTGSREDGYVLAVNGKNPVRELSAVQIKDVFDEEITNWSEVGGPDIGIKVFRLEDITSYFSEEELGAEYDKAGECIGKVVADHPGIMLLSRQSL